MSNNSKSKFQSGLFNSSGGSAVRDRGLEVKIRLFWSNCLMSDSCCYFTANIFPCTGGTSPLKVLCVRSSSSFSSSSSSSSSSLFRNGTELIPSGEVSLKRDVRRSNCGCWSTGMTCTPSSDSQRFHLTRV